MHTLALISEPAIDPVCGMTVDPAASAGSFSYKGKTYHFCSQHCLERFKADPEHYLHGKISDKSSCCQGMTDTVTAPGTRYTCPMHPEILTEKPGTCPKCGMALEPMIPELGKGDTTEL
jgi:Cu+-exporting ATPase